MVAFDESGYLTPYALIPLDIITFERTFVLEATNVDRRRHLLAQFITYTEGVKKLINEPFTVWVNGSFITQKPNPADIDFVVFINFDTYRRHEEQLDRFRRLRYEYATGIDGYFVLVYPEAHPRRNWYESDRLRWLHDFGSSLRNQKKGIVELTF